MNTLPNVVNNEWQRWEEKPGNPRPMLFHSSTARQKILKTPLAFQPSLESYLKDAEDQQTPGNGLWS